MSPNPALEPTAASGLRRLAVPSSLRASAAAQRERWASEQCTSGPSWSCARLEHSLASVFVPTFFGRYKA
jgi:hypothetical protein